MLKNLLKYFVITGLIEGYFQVKEHDTRSRYYYDPRTDFIDGFCIGWIQLPLDVINYCIEKFDKKSDEISDKLNDLMKKEV